MQYMQRGIVPRVIHKGQRKWEQRDQVCCKCWSSPRPNGNRRGTFQAERDCSCARYSWDVEEYSIEMQIGGAWESKLAHEITRAGELEREMAIERNDSFEGIPAITVTVDGGWY